MKSLRVAVALAALLVAGAAVASTTWTKSTAVPYPNAVSTSTTGTEAAPTNGAGSAPDGGIVPKPGLELLALGGITVCVEAYASDAGPFIGGTLDAYVLNPISNAWARAKELDVTVAAGLYRQCFVGFVVPSPTGSIAFVPNGLGTGARVYIIGARP